MDECPLCGAKVKGDECGCGQAEEGVWLILYRLAMDSSGYLNPNYYGYVAADKATATGISIATKVSVMYPVFFAPASSLSDEARTALSAYVAKDVQDKRRRGFNFSLLRGTSWHRFTPLDEVP